MRTLPCLAVMVSILQGGCATVAPPAPSPTVRESLGVVAIVPAQYVPDSNFITFAKGKGAGAAKGAAIEGGTTAVALGVWAAAVSPVVPFSLLAGVLATIAAVGAVEGAAEGAQQAVPKEAAQEIETVINEAVAGLDAQNLLAGRLATIVQAEPRLRLAAVSATGPDNVTARPTYAQLRNAGINTVLEVAITRIGFESCGPEFLRSHSGGCPQDAETERVDLFVSAQSRLVRVTDGAELFMRQYRYASPRREFSRWAANAGQLLAEEFDHAFRELAERVHDEVFLIAPIDLPAPSSAGGVPGPGNPLYGICWLAPVYPGVEAIRVSEMFVIPFSRPADFCPASGLHFAVIDTLRPTLRWSAFPRDLDRRQLDPKTLRLITAVTYDLKIWEAEGCERGRLVYGRTGIVAPEHPMEESLPPASRYFWSVRARFDLDSRPMATRWAHFDPMSCFPNDIADWQYHRFVTPR